MKQSENNKFNMILIKNILNFLNNHVPDEITLSALFLSLDDSYSEDKIEDYCIMLIKEKYINGQQIYADGKVGYIFIRGLTDQGRMLLSKINKLKDKKLTEINSFEETKNINQSSKFIRMLHFLAKKLFFPILTAIIASYITYKLTKG